MSETCKVKNLAPVNPTDTRAWHSGEIVLEHGAYRSVSASVRAFNDEATWLEFTFANTLRVNVVASSKVMRELGAHLIAAADASERVTTTEVA